MGNQGERLQEFSSIIDRICGEANEAACLAADLFDGEELQVVRRELARMMEISEAKILPIVRKAEEGS
ncbi:MAG: hypothetical protein AAF270_14305 [Pseudomonadota bacterium]